MAHTHHATAVRWLNLLQEISSIEGRRGVLLFDVPVYNGQSPYRH
jgi:hypothetical protein